MLRFGIVSQINALNAQARVSFQDDESTSYWLPVLQTKTLKDKFYVMPDIGELVACLMDENSEDGVILGTIYSTEDVPVTQSEKEISIRELMHYLNAKILIAGSITPDVYDMANDLILIQEIKEARHLPLIKQCNIYDKFK